MHPQNWEFILEFHTYLSYSAALFEMQPKSCFGVSFIIPGKVPIAEDLQSTDDCVSNQEMKKDIPAYNNLLSIPSIGDRAARPDPMVMDGLRIAGRQV